MGWEERGVDIEKGDGGQVRWAVREESEKRRKPERLEGRKRAKRNKSWGLQGKKITGGMTESERHSTSGLTIQLLSGALWKGGGGLLLGVEWRISLRHWCWKRMSAELTLAQAPDVHPVIYGGPLSHRRQGRSRELRQFAHSDIAKRRLSCM